jgi:hypothetical protein
MACCPPRRRRDHRDHGEVSVTCGVRKSCDHTNALQKVYNPGMKHISEGIKRTFAKSKETERGELMEFFCHRLNIQRVQDGYSKVTMGRMGKLLEKIPTKDLYYLKSVCEKSKNFSKKFWWEVNPKNHDSQQT